MDADINVIISVVALAALMFSPVVAILLVPTAEKHYRPPNAGDTSQN